MPEPHEPVMDLSNVFTPDAVISNLRVSSKKQALQELAKHAAQDTGLTERVIFDVLLERERLGTTGVGRGIAIPHGKISGLDHLYGLLAKLDRPVPFESVDEQDVDLIFLLLAPESAGAEHLRALARISRIMRDRAVCELLRAGESPEELTQAITDNATSPVA